MCLAVMHMQRWSSSAARQPGRSSGRGQASQGRARFFPHLSWWSAPAGSRARRRSGQSQTPPPPVGLSRGACRGAQSGEGASGDEGRAGAAATPDPSATRGTAVRSSGSTKPRYPGSGAHLGVHVGQHAALLLVKAGILRGVQHACGGERTGTWRRVCRSAGGGAEGPPAPDASHAGSPTSIPPGP